jgi:hypothetical protein
MHATAIHVRRLFHGFAFRAAVFLAIRGASAYGMCAFFSFFGGHGVSSLLTFF